MTRVTSYHVKKLHPIKNYIERNEKITSREIATSYQKSCYILSNRATSYQKLHRDNFFFTSLDVISQNRKRNVDVCFKTAKTMGFLQKL